MAEHELREELGDVALVTTESSTQSQSLPEATVTASELELRQTLSQSMQPQQQHRQLHSMLGQETMLRDEAWQSLGRWPMVAHVTDTDREQRGDGESRSCADGADRAARVAASSGLGA